MSARLAGALNTQLTTAEARGAELALNPDSMDLYFQDLTWLNKGQTPESSAQARSFFDRALAADPDNLDFLVQSARVDVVRGSFSFVADPIAAFAAAEAKLTKAWSSVPDHALGHTWLGLWTYSPGALQTASPNVNMRWGWIGSIPPASAGDGRGQLIRSNGSSRRALRPAHPLRRWRAVMV